jgi:hypothetical protein
MTGHNGNAECAPQVEQSHYVEEGFSWLRIENVTEQLRVICRSGCTSILEIGVGRGLLKHFLEPFPEISHVGIEHRWHSFFILEP